MLSVLTQFQWIQGRIADDRTAILSKCLCAEALLKRTSSSAEYGALNFSSGGLQFICSPNDCLMVVADGVKAKSDGTLAESLLQLAQSFASSRGAFSDDAFIVNKLAASVERRVRGPWLKPVSGCCRVHSSGQRVPPKAVVGDKSGVKSVVALGDGKQKARMKDLNSMDICAAHQPLQNMLSESNLPSSATAPCFPKNSSSLQ